MKPIHAKPQSGRAIEPGLVLRIVSKRGRTVMFGQTGLLFANRQWGSQDNGKTSCILPIAFSAQKFKSIGIHRESNAVIVVELEDYSNSLTQTGFKTLDSNGSYIDYADVQWISIGK